MTYGNTLSYGSIEDSEINHIQENNLKKEDEEKHRRESVDAEINEDPVIHRTARNQILGTKGQCLRKYILKIEFLGSFLALLSCGFFTTNNFLINQFSVSVPDLFLLRSIFNLIIYSSICYFRYAY